MTKAERLAERIERAKVKLAKQQRALDMSRALQREEARKLTNKWRFQVGSIADEAGLRAWSTTDLIAVFQALACFPTVPDALAAIETGLDLFGDADLRRDLAPCPPVSRLEPLPYAKYDLSPITCDTESTGCVYVVQMEGHPWLKIGSTHQLKRRVMFLQIGCPQPLHIRKLYPCARPEEVEVGLHIRLASYRRTGEWFDTDLLTIDEALRDMNPPVWEQAQELGTDATAAD